MRGCVLHGTDIHPLLLSCDECLSALQGLMLLAGASRIRIICADQFLMVGGLIAGHLL